jgi:hypothetical protein
MGGQRRTGNVYTNIYINNHGFIQEGLPDRVRCNQGFMLEGEESECTIEQLNVEHLTAYQPIYLLNVLGLFASAIHLEGVRCIDNYQPFVYISKTMGNIENISFYYTRHKNGQSLIKFGDVQDTSTETDIFGGVKGLTIGNLICKGLNRPDRDTYGYGTEYPVTASTISSRSTTTGFRFIDRESASDRYIFRLKSYNWITYTYQYDDSQEYINFYMNPHNSIKVLELPLLTHTYPSDDLPTKMLYDGLTVFDNTSNKLLTYNNGHWYDSAGNQIQ